MSDDVRRLKAARLAVSQACTVCRNVQSNLEDVRSELKDDRSPVTVADYASQAVVARTLAEELDGVTLVAEESASGLREQVAAGNTLLVDAIVEAVACVWPAASRDDVLDAIDLGGAEPARDSVHGFWTLDPIDGTKGFLRGEQYAVALAWVENGSATVGAMGCPNLSRDFNRPFSDPDPHGAMYLAITDMGLAEAPADDPDVKALPIQRLESEAGQPLRLCESVESGHTKHDATAAIMDHLDQPRESARLDSQAKYAVVARGQADVYLRMPTRKGYVERIWDHAAGSLVAIEGGCAVTDILGNPLDFSHGRGLEKNLGIVVAPHALHGRLIGAIEALGLNRPPA